VELDDGLLLLQAELAPLDVRPEVVGPPEPAALAAPLQPCRKKGPCRMASEEAWLISQRRKEQRTGLGGQRAPAAVAVLVNVGEQVLVLLRRPRPPLQSVLVAARRSPHPHLPAIIEQQQQQRCSSTPTLLAHYSFPLIAPRPIGGQLTARDPPRRRTGGENGKQGAKATHWCSDVVISSPAGLLLVVGVRHK
jgi:hypothetical protein